MAIEDVKTLQMVRTQAQAQALLDEGWQLLGVFDRGDGNDQYAEYHFGKTGESTSSGKMFLLKQVREKFGIK
ncbi:hypothetical protein [Pseudomonas fluorescens]|uniref:hypothetical protein n=1 Tax=Pseudomonas fluorescens TaxID=294 RepID=UPI001242FF58|nr:hypothetical protein [Pseudomonas fluorescens]VVN44906.1 hypothetical protein PS639_05658 [Pseudomonas fluorescens]